jgi:CarboxypepD_reg-like domain
MKGEKDNIKYSAEDIRRYLDGQFSDMEMQALEKAALEDPFLSDAIEGIEESRNHPASFESGLEDLQKSLEKRIREKSRKSGIVPLFLNWKIAASIVFIIGIAALTLTYINKKTSRSEIAKSIQTDSNSEKPFVLPAIKAPDSSVRSSSIPLTVNSESEKEVNADNHQTGTNKRSDQKKLLSLSQDKTQDSLTQKRDDHQSLYLSKTSSDTTGGSGTLISVAKNNEPVPGNLNIEKNKVVTRGEAPARTVYKSTSENYIKGFVIDEKGNPIPNAAVSIKGVKRSAITDHAGFFKLYAIDPEFANQIIINSSGYESFSERLNSDSSYTNIIRLTPASAALSEVVVKKNSTEPATGWDAFKNYIDSNKKIQTADSVLEGEEVISFVVNKKSELSSFKIEKSISPAHDAEIIRLIKEAPPLKISKGKRKRLQVNIVFK